MRLKREFFEQPTLKAAQELLGKILIRKRSGEKTRAVISETEAYFGFDDLASHAARGMTARNKIMFGPAGYLYVYLIYGLHHCLNIVTEKENFPAAVLIRSVTLLECGQRLDGPGKLTKALSISRALNGEDICQSKKIWLEDGGLDGFKIKSSPRVGVDYAGFWAKKHWRFVLTN